MSSMQVNLQLAISANAAIRAVLSEHGQDASEHLKEASNNLDDLIDNLENELVK